MQALHYAESVQDIFEQPEQPPRDWTLYKMDVSHLYDEPNADWALPINSGNALAYYAVSPSHPDWQIDDAEHYVGTYWPASKEWVQDHVIDLMLHRAQKVAQLDRVDESDVINAARKWLEKSNVSA